MFDISDLSKELQSTGKSSTFPFKDTSLDSVALNPLDMFPRQNQIEKLIFLLSALNKYFFSINKQITIIGITM